jgi:hypothetical protein
MRTLVSTILVGVSLIAGPAFAQQNPWVPSGMNAPVGSLPNGDPAVTPNPWVASTVYEGSLPNGDAARAEVRIRSDIGSRHHSDTQRGR